MLRKIKKIEKNTTTEETPIETITETIETPIKKLKAKKEPKQELLPDFKISKDIFDFVIDLSSKTVEEPKKETKTISDLEVARKLVNIHSSAQSRNLEFNLTFEYVKKLLEYKTCYYTNVTFSEDGPNQRTFDRLDNDKGYIVGNVVACNSDINGKKNNLSIEEIICLYKKLGHLKK
jgi:hypothetical protein